mmetsp:Transcript_54488/g.127281  ORF Transcript_54488/g.127281 Transcript_54488/m.127281 type:complete len:546 (-) Transcript_54488:71-1708(-)
MVKLTTSVGLWHNCLCSLDGSPYGEKTGSGAESRKGLRVKWELPPAVAACAGDSGPECAAWLLNNHTLRRQHTAPYTARDIREALQVAWRSHLHSDKDRWHFVEQRAEQVVDDRSLCQSVESRTAALLDRLMRDPGCGGAYCFIASDWQRLSEHFEVDFVLHGLAGMADWPCARCDTCGHIHLGRESDVRPSLHVCWWSRDGLPGVWEPLGPSNAEESACASRAEAAEGDCSVDSDSGMAETAFKQAPECLSMWSGVVTVGDGAPDDSQTQDSELEASNPYSMAGACFENGFQCVNDRHAAMGQSTEGSHATLESDSPESQNRDMTRPLFPGASPRRAARGSTQPVARFSILLEDKGERGASSKTMKDEGWLREAFIAAVADAAGVSVARVRVLEVGPPFDLEAGLARKSVAQRKAVQEPGTKPDTGAGVMRMLEEEESGLTVDSNGHAVTRVLGTIKEAAASDGLLAEPSALQALDRVAAELQDPMSPLQMTLKMWSGGQPARLWMPPSPNTQHRQPRVGRAARLRAALNSAEGQRAVVGALLR